MILFKKPGMQGAEISSKLKAQRAIVINTFQLSASGFQLLCNAADWVFFSGIMSVLAQLGKTAMQTAIRTQSANAIRVFDAAYGLAANVGVMLPFCPG
jgi:hypothetical protein